MGAQLCTGPQRKATSRLHRAGLPLSPASGPRPSRLVGDVAGRSRLPEKWQIKTGPQRSPLQLRASALDVGKIESQFECPLVQNTQATNLAQVLEVLWTKIAECIDEKKSMVLYFDACTALQNPVAVNRLASHMDVCADCCETFGTSLKLSAVPTTEKSPPLFYIKNYNWGKDDEEDSWDDDDDWGSDLLAKYADVLNKDKEVTAEDEALKKLNEVPSSDTEILKVIRDWVNVIVSDMGICPFSQSADKAGLPVGPVHYPISRLSRPEDVYAVYWREVDYLISRPEKDISTTLLILPEFHLGNAEAWQTFTDTISQPLEPLGIEKMIQLVYFHPQWVFRDGADRMGETGAANYARRSNFPMINILRTNQVRLAQKSIPTGLVYTQNEETLVEVGSDALQDMLVRRDWSALKDLRVDRRYNKLGKIAQMLRDHDGTPPEEVAMALEEQIKELEAQAKAGTSTLSRPPQPAASGGVDPSAGMGGGGIKIQEASDDTDTGMAF